jgi:hypothetical protein
MGTPDADVLTFLQKGKAMRARYSFPILAVVLALIAVPSAAGVPVIVTVTGEVEFNQINTPPLGDVSPGDPVMMSFVVDSDVFTDSDLFPTRGYEIDPWSFSLEFGDAIELGLQDPLPMDVTPYFVLRDNDPAVDGFFVATNIVNPFGFGIPLAQTGIFDQFAASFRVTYENDTLSSLDILDALGTYDFSGLTVFGWSIDDGPFEAMFIIFEQLTLVAIPVDDDGDGILNGDDLCPDTIIPESVPTHHLGTNRWALVDEDGVFDTNPPNGIGPGFMFDLDDTGGCSCEQIVEMVGLGDGHVKFGCSNGAMLDWIQDVAGSGYQTGDEPLPDPRDLVPASRPEGGLMDLQQASEYRDWDDYYRPRRLQRARAGR